MNPLLSQFISLVCAAMVLISGSRCVFAAQEKAAAETTETQENLKLAIGDKLNFLITEDPAENKQKRQILVNSLGEAEFQVTQGSLAPSITLKAVGRTLKELRDELRSKLEADFYTKATLELELQDRGMKGGKAYVFGDGMGRAQTINLPPDEKISIFIAVMNAGPSEFAKLDKVKLMRKDDNGKVITRIIDLKKIQKGDNKDDVVLQDGDRIDVPEKGFSIK